MTQEELDALMAGGLDEEFDEEESQERDDTTENTDEIKEEQNDEKDAEEEGVYPPPADEKHRVVAQLDEVTKESEEKASEVLDKIDEISNVIADTTEGMEKIIEFLENEKELFTKLNNAFPHIKKFEEELNKIDEISEIANKMLEDNQNAGDEIFTVMDIMQYQDIHRQKIERVINIMRALIKYMNVLFEGKIEDEKRVKSARHIEGDENEDVMSNDDIEKILAEFGG